MYIWILKFSLSHLYVKFTHRWLKLFFFYLFLWSSLGDQFFSMRIYEDKHFVYKFYTFSRKWWNINFIARLATIYLEYNHSVAKPDVFWKRKGTYKYQNIKICTKKQPMKVVIFLYIKIFKWLLRKIVNLTELYIPFELDSSL